MRNAAKAAVAAVALLASGPALATNGMRMIGFGPCQDAMGGLGTAVTLDANAVLSNPAGLTELSRRLDVGLTWFKPTVKYSATESQMPPGFEGAVVAQPGAQLESRRGGSPIPALAMALPLSKEVTLGIGLFGVAGMGVDYAQNLYGGRTYSSYLQARLTPGVGWKATDTLSVGLTFNGMMAQMKWDVASGFGQVPHDTATSFGYGATLGLKYRPVKPLALAVSYETKSTFQDFSFDVPAHVGVNPATFAPVSFPGGKDKLKFDQPQSLTFGAAWGGMESWLVGAELQWIDWSSTNGTNQPRFTNDTSLTGAMPWNLGWKDQWVLKAGTMVRATRDLYVRLGWNYGKSPLNKDRAFENIAFPAIAEHHVTGGFGYEFSDAFCAQIGAIYAPTVTISGSNPTYPAQGGQAIAAYETKMSQFAIDAGVTWKF